MRRCGACRTLCQRISVVVAKAKASRIGCPTRPEASRRRLRALRLMALRGGQRSPTKYHCASVRPTIRLQLNAGSRHRPIGRTTATRPRRADQHPPEVAQLWFLCRYPDTSTHIRSRANPR
jgi:hypothetical protein